MSTVWPANSTTLDRSPGRSLSARFPAVSGIISNAASCCLFSRHACQNDKTEAEEGMFTATQ